MPFVGPKPVIGMRTFGTVGEEKGTTYGPLTKLSSVCKGKPSSMMKRGTKGTATTFC